MANLHSSVLLSSAASNSSVIYKAKERPHTSKAKAKAKPKNTSVPKTQRGASAGLKQFIAEQRAKKEEDPQ